MEVREGRAPLAERTGGCLSRKGGTVSMHSQTHLLTRELAHLAASSGEATPVAPSEWGSPIHARSWLRAAKIFVYLQVAYLCSTQRVVRECSVRSARLLLAGLQRSAGWGS